MRTAADDRSRRILVGCHRGMGDILYVSSIVSRLRDTLAPDVGIDLAVGRGLWADTVRHLPAVDRIVPTDSWDDIRAIGAEGGYDQIRLARVSEWMPWKRYAGWTWRARFERKHLIDVLAAGLGVRLPPGARHPLYVFHPDDTEDDDAPAAALGRYAVVAPHGFTHHAHNAATWHRLIPPLVADAERRGHRLVILGPPGEPLPASPAVFDRRGLPIRPVAALVRGAAVVISVLNGITVLADALARPIVLLAFGRDPVSVVGPLRPPLAVFGRPGRAGAASVDTHALVARVGEALARE